MIQNKFLLIKIMRLLRKKIKMSKIKNRKKVNMKKSLRNIWIVQYVWNNSKMDVK